VEVFRKAPHRQTPCVPLAFNLMTHILIWVVGVAYFGDYSAASGSHSHGHRNEGNDMYIVVMACIASFAMGSHMAFCGRYLASFPTTNVMTSNTRLFSSSTAHFVVLKLLLRDRYQVETLKLAEDDHGKAWIKWKNSSLVLASFILGCVVGAVVVNEVGWHLAAFTAMIVAALIVDLALKPDT
jgi:hypothetical protein